MPSDPTLQRPLPHSIEAERSVLGAVMVNNEAFYPLADRIGPGDFYQNGHRLTFQAMTRLMENRTPVDPVTLGEELERNGILEEVGGRAYLASLMDGVPPSLNVEHHARIIAEKSTLRQLVAASDRTVQAAMDGSDGSEEILAEAQRVIFQIAQGRDRGGFRGIKEILDESIESIDRLQETRSAVTGVPTGFELLDEYTSGFQPADLVLVAARPSVGKTALALSIAQNASMDHEKSVGIFSLEMTREQLVMRLLCSEARVDSHHLRRGYLTDRDWDRITAAMGRLAGAHLFIDDTPGLKPLSLRTRARQLKAERGLDLIIVDYIQLMSAGGYRENRNLEIGEISRGLKEMAMELHVPVIGISQLSRAIESRSDSRPQLSDLRESGCLCGESLVTMADGGRRVPIRDLAGREGFRILALNEETWKIEPTEVSRAFATGVKPVLTLQTRLGRQIRATANHRFRAFEGWKRLDELCVGDRIAVPRESDPVSSVTMSDQELALLGHLIGDGCTLPRHAIQYTTCEMDLAESVQDLASRVFGTKVRPRIKTERTWFQVYLTSARHHTHGVRNPVSEWLDRLGVFGLRSHEKRVPEAVFEQPRAGIALFLRHLWATDGSVGTRSVGGGRRIPNIYYASSSSSLARDVQSLLLRLGICARRTMVPQGSKGRDQYHVSLSGKENVSRFLDLVGGVGKRREREIEAIRFLIGPSTHNPSCDVIPRHAWKEMVIPAMQAERMTHRQLAANLSMSYGGSTLYKSNLSRERAGRVARAVSCPELALLAESDVYWDEVIAIEEDGETEVFDLTVPGPHNFVAEDIIAHNSLEQDADVVIFINRKPSHMASEEERGTAEIIIGKQRNGPTGAFKLAFIEQFTRFENLSLVDEEFA